MLDLHCHFLPGVDDGPETMAEALEMARAAVADGIRLSVLTAHIWPNRYDNTRDNLQAAIDAFAAQLDANGISLQVRLGCEAYLSPDLLDLIAAGQVPFLGEVDGYRILLIELPHQMIPVGTERLIVALLRQRIRPLIAHPERNQAVMHDPERIRPFAGLGCWLQLTAGSLTGDWGAAAEQAAWRLLDAGWNCVVATDAHDPRHRPPRLSAGREALRRRHGEEFALDHVVRKPARIVGVAASSLS